MKETNRRLLPPMAMLHSFAAAARHGSFSSAARELGLTQGAVSRQVAGLEEWVGRLLFERNGRRVALNAEGRRYADAIEAALSGIRQATRRAIEQPREKVLELATLPSFGMRWLAPRLPRLTRQHPDLIVNFTARADEFSFTDQPFHAAIHFGRPDWPGVVHDLMFRESAIPVLAPDLAHRVHTPRDLLGLPLLVQSLRRDAWARWFAQVGVGMGSRAGSILPAASFTQFLMLAQAAVAGAGAALIPSFLIGPELESGALVSPFGDALNSEDAYYLVYPPAMLETPGMADLRNWLLAEAAADALATPTRAEAPSKAS